MRALFAGLLLVTLAQAEVVILEHDLVVEIDPATSRIEARDTVRARGPGTITIPAFEGIEVSPSHTIEVPEGEHDITVVFKGTIKNDVQKSGAATWVSGDKTAGTIGPKGSYLFQGFYVPRRARRSSRRRSRFRCPTARLFPASASRSRRPTARTR